jgi:hypothetical protein
MKRWTKLAGAAICILAASVSPAFAQGAVDMPPASAGEVAPSAEITLRGVLTYTDLEGGFYSVDGYMLRGESSVFRPLIGKVVLVRGTLFDGMSFQMVKTVDVTDIQVDPDQSVSNNPGNLPVLTPVPDGMGLIAVEPSRPAPAAIAIDGREIAFDQGPLVSEETLMVPLRFLVEAAGGEVEWDGAQCQVTARMPDRVVTFEIGNRSAEVNRGGRETVKIDMAKSPVLANDRTLVSADTLTNVLGFMERRAPEVGQEGAESRMMELVVPIPGPVEEIRSTLTGTVKEVEVGESTRILVEGGPMASGEPSLTWVSISNETAIFVEEDGEKVGGSITDLAVGQTIEAEVGAVLMSYPARAGATSVTIKK